MLRRLSRLPRGVSRCSIECVIDVVCSTSCKSGRWSPFSSQCLVTARVFFAPLMRETMPWRQGGSATALLLLVLLLMRTDEPEKGQRFLSGGFLPLRSHIFTARARHKKRRLYDIGMDCCSSLEMLKTGPGQSGLGRRGSLD